MSCFARWWRGVLFFVSFLFVFSLLSRCVGCACWLQARAAPHVSQFAGSCSGSAEIGASEVEESGAAAVVSLCVALQAGDHVLHCVRCPALLRAVLLCS